MDKKPLFESWWKPWRWNGSNWFVAVLAWIVLTLAGLRVAMFFVQSFGE